MNTFLPYPEFERSAACLDWRRLGKQRVETWQILRALCGTGGWRNHPATRMWLGAEKMLAIYGAEMCREWRSRGYVDTMLDRFVLLANSNQPLVVPAWLGNPEFHATHRSNLLRKDPAHYGRFGWSESPDLPYLWPGAPHGTPRAVGRRGVLT